MMMRKMLMKITMMVIMAMTDDYSNHPGWMSRWEDHDKRNYVATMMMMAMMIMMMNLMMVVVMMVTMTTTWLDVSSGIS